MKSLVQTIAACGLVLATASADWRETIGHERLEMLVGPELPAIPGQGFTQAEAPEASGAYAPDTASSLYTGKNFTAKSGATSLSNHAETVAKVFYGNTTSLSAGNCPVDLYNANSWLNSGFLKTGTNAEPSVELRAVQNHSWIGTLTPDSDAIDAGRRLDHVIQRDGIVSVVGVNNGNGTVLPQLLCQGYHSISVGLSNGNHSAGFTTLDGAGRVKPELVAPDGATSFATPMVAASAALLHAKVTALPQPPAVLDHPRIIKALLLAAARKDTVASWSNTPTRPLDLRYGAGELNIHHAYRTLSAGRATASTSTSGKSTGWAAESGSGNSTRTYHFTIAPGSTPAPFSVALVWHRTVTDGNPGPNSWGNPAASLADLNLRLHSTEGFTLGPVVAESASSVDNLELIHQPALPPGSYALVVKNTSVTSTPFAAAWHSLPAVSIAATAAEARETDAAPGEITITRSGDASLPLFVPLHTGGTAVAGTDFLPLPASVVIPAGETSAILPVIPISDNLATGDRSLSVSIATDFTFTRDPGNSAAIMIRDKPFDAWRFSKFSALELIDPAISSATADPDGDGLRNLVEFAFALEPETPDVSPLVVSVDSNHLVLSVTKNPAATDVAWAAEWSENLEQWFPATVSFEDTDTFIAADNSLETNLFRRFIRLRLIRQ